MLVNRIWLTIITFGMMISLSVLTKNTIVSGGTTIVTIVIGYIIIAYVRSKRRLSKSKRSFDLN